MKDRTKDMRSIGIGKDGSSLNTAPTPLRSIRQVTLLRKTEIFVHMTPHFFLQSTRLLSCPPFPLPLLSLRSRLKVLT
jgi:hypothetical protein